MANNTIHIPRTHLIMGLCLPLAVLMGYLLAEPTESGSLAVIIMVFAVLAVPILMKWYHFLLIVTWSAVIYPFFIPGRPALWMVVAAAGLFFAILNRSVSGHRRFLDVPSITRPLIFFAAVVVITAMATGGIGLRMLGSDRHGGKNYFYIFAAIAGYFALTSQAVPPHRARLYAALFFLSALTSLAPVLAAGVSRSLLSIFMPQTPPDVVLLSDPLAQGITRFNGLGPAAFAVFCFLLCRYGLRDGVLDLGAPWRVALALLALGASAASGYRSALILLLLTGMCVFWLEGLWRTKFLPMLAGAALVCGGILLTQAQHLPLVVQRTLSFLPIEVDALVRENARASNEWRLEMWKHVLPDVPRYLIKGKGYSLDPNQVDMEFLALNRGFSTTTTGSEAVGDYHNGPLSVIIPFGLAGTVGFIWLLTAGWRLLLHYHRFGHPSLQRVNTFLLALFIAKILHFVFIFGGISTDLYMFVGLIGLSVSLNAGTPALQAEEEDLAAYESLGHEVRRV